MPSRVSAAVAVGGVRPGAAFQEWSRSWRGRLTRSGLADDSPQGLWVGAARRPLQVRCRRVPAGGAWSALPSRGSERTGPTWIPLASPGDWSEAAPEI